MFFGNASATINLDGSLDNKFNIERVVRQRCALVAYIFLIVDVVLTYNIKKIVDERQLKGIILPWGK